MFTFNPGEAPAVKSSMDFVAALTVILADPHGTATHLAEMQAKLDELIALDAALRTRTTEAEAAHKAADQSIADREAALANRVAALTDIAAATAESDRRLAAAKDAEHDLAAGQEAHRVREAAIAQMEKDAAIRMRQLDSRAAGLDARDAALSAQEADYQQRVAQWKKFAGIGAQ